MVRNKSYQEFRASLEAKHGNGVVGTCPLPNHWVLPTAASLGWTVEAAAANPLRSAEEALLTEKA